MKLALLLFALPACTVFDGGDSTLVDAGANASVDADRHCVIEEVTARLIGDAVVDECGTLDVSAGDAALTAAHDCVVAHASAGTPFHVQWAIQGIDSRVARGVVGVDDALYYLRYDGDPGGGGGDGRPRTYTMTCSSIDDLGACSDLPYSLCIECPSQPSFDLCQ